MKVSRHLLMPFCQWLYKRRHPRKPEPINIALAPLSPDTSNPWTASDWGGNRQGIAVPWLFLFSNSLCMQHKLMLYVHTAPVFAPAITVVSGATA